MAGSAKNNMCSSYLGVPCFPADFWPPCAISLPNSSRGGGDAMFDRTSGSGLEELKAQDELLEDTEQHFHTGTEREERIQKNRLEHIVIIKSNQAN